MDEKRRIDIEDDFMEYQKAFMRVVSKMSHKEESPFRDELP